MKCTRNPLAGNALASRDKKYFSKIDIDTGEGGLNMFERERKNKKKAKIWKGRREKLN